MTRRRVFIPRRCTSELLDDVGAQQRQRLDLRRLAPLLAQAIGGRFHFLRRHRRVGEQRVDAHLARLVVDAELHRAADVLIDAVGRRHRLLLGRPRRVPLEVEVVVEADEEDALEPAGVRHRQPQLRRARAQRGVDALSSPRQNARSPAVRSCVGRRVRAHWNPLVAARGVGERTKKGISTTTAAAAATPAAQRCVGANHCERALPRRLRRAPRRRGSRLRGAPASTTTACRAPAVRRAACARRARRGRSERGRRRSREVRAQLVPLRRLDVADDHLVDQSYVSLVAGAMLIAPS